MIAVHHRWMLVALTAALAAIAALLWLASSLADTREAAEARVAPSSQPPQQAPGELVSFESAEPPREPERVALDQAEVPARGAAPGTVGSVHEGRVVRPDGQPLPGATIVAEDSGMLLARSSGDGGFVLAEGTRAGVSLVVGTRGYETLLAARTAEPGRELVLVAAAQVSLRGRTVDGVGEVPEVALALVLPEGLQERLQKLCAFDVGSARWGTRNRYSDAHGAFEWTVPSLPGARILARKSGYLDSLLSLPEGPAEGLEIVLRRERDALATGLCGRVVYAGGGPAEGATVSFGECSTRSDARGEFVLGLGRHAPDDALFATLAGCMPAVLADFGAFLEEHPDPLPFVELELLPGSEEITGTLVDELGVPCEGWFVKLAQGTLVSRGYNLPVYAESPDVPGGAQRTGPTGRFAFAPLTPGSSHRLRAWNEETLESATSEPFPAGAQDVLFRLPRRDLRALVDGIACGFDGTPLEGIRVRLTMTLHEEESGRWMHTGQEMKTGPDGRFEFRDVPRSPVYLRLDGEGVEGRRVDLDAADPCRDLRVELARTGQLSFERLGGDIEPFEFRVLDAAGESLHMRYELEPGHTTGGTSLALAQVGTRPVSVSESAAWLVLLDQGVEIERLPLAVRHGQLTTIRR